MKTRNRTSIPRAKGVHSSFLLGFPPSSSCYDGASPRATTMRCDGVSLQTQDRVCAPYKQAQRTQHQACSVTRGRVLLSWQPLNLFFFRKKPCDWLLLQRCYQSAARCYDREKLSNEDWDALLVREARVGSTSEEGGKSLNQPITMLDRSSSSNSI